MSSSMLALRRLLAQMGYPTPIMSSTQVMALLRYYKHIGGEEAKYLMGHPELQSLLEQEGLTGPPAKASSVHGQSQSTQATAGPEAL